MTDRHAIHGPSPRACARELVEFLQLHRPTLPWRLMAFRVQSGVLDEDPVSQHTFAPSAWEAATAWICGYISLGCVVTITLPDDVPDGAVS